MKRLLLLLALLLAPVAAHAQIKVVAACGAQSLTPGQSSGVQYMDATGKVCTSATGGGGGGTVTANQGTAGSAAWLMKSGPLTIVPLTVSSVTTGGSAVTALPAGSATAGGFIVTANAAGICVDQQTTAGTATGTPSSTVCVAANQSYQLVPNTSAVSVNSTASSVSFGGEGLQ